MNETSEVKLHFLDYWRVIKVRSGIVILAFLLVMITAGITVYFLPREFYSKVSLEVHSDFHREVNTMDSGGQRGGAIDPREMETQFAIVQKKEVLYPVIENLKLQDTWGGSQKLPLEQAYIRLLGMLDMREERNTTLMDIGCYSTDPKEAANIANSIAVEYKAKRISDMNKLVEAGLGQLKETVDEQKRKMDDAQALVIKIRTEKGIIDLNPNDVDTKNDTDESSVRQRAEQLTEQTLKVTELQTQQEQLANLKPEDLLAVMGPLQINDPTVAKALPLYQDAVADEAKLLSTGFGENHPRLQATRALKQVYSQQLRDGLDSVKKGKAAELDIAQKRLAALTTEQAKYNDVFQGNRNQGTDYLEAKARFIEQKKLYDAAALQYQTQRISQTLSWVPVTIWETAEPALYPAKPRIPIYMALAFVIGLTVGVCLAFFIEYLDTSVKTMEDVEKFLAIPVLAVIPKGMSLLHRQGSDTADAEAYRILRTNIEFNRKSPDSNTITLVSGGPGEGKSTTLANLAYTCAKGGYNVLVVDADLRRPTQHKIFDEDNSVGLTNYLTSNMDFEEIVRPTSVENLSFIPSGILPSDAVGILNSQRMSDLISRVKRRYDLVFFDSPPILGVSDGSILASEVDLTIMVVQHRRFPRSMLQRVKQAVLNVGGNLLGVVLNNVDTKHDQGYQYYTNYYDYYSPQAQDKPTPTPKLEPMRVPAARNRPAAHHGEQY